MKKLVLGSRGSALALQQSRIVLKMLRQAWPETQFEEKIIKTAGDQLQDKDNPPLPPGKGIFTKEIEEALIRGEIHLAVHSLKDLPTELDSRLALAAIAERTDARDVLITRGPLSLAELPPGAQIATGSPRRAAQVLLQRPDLKTVDVRGNIDTRLRKLRERSEWTALVLARAGLDRLQPDLSGLTVTTLPLDEMLPAPGQGALALQVRADDKTTLKLAAAAEHPPTRAEVTAERAFLAGLGGGCLMPIAACAAVKGDGLELRGICWLNNAKEPRRGSIKGSVKQAEKLGRDLARQLSS